MSDTSGLVDDDSVERRADVPAGAAPMQAPPTNAPQVRKGDLTQGPILSTLLAFSIPMLIGNVLQTLSGSINSIWVGRLLGEGALAATANANVVMFMLFAAVFGFGMATTVRVGQHFGGRDLDGARVTFGTGIGFCVIVAVISSAIGAWFSADLLTALATPEASRADALAYLRVIFITLPFSTLSLVLSMGLRGVGDSKTPLYTMIITVTLDAVLNPLLIRGAGPIPGLGIAGSAIATGTASLIAAIWTIAMVYRRDLPLRLKGRELGYLIPRASELRFLVTKGLPMGAQMLLFSSAGLIMIRLVNREGLDTTAAYGASLQLWNYLQMPAFAVGSAVSAMVAQCLGAGVYARIGKVTRVGILANLAMSAVLGLLIVLCDRPLLALFLGHGSPAIAIGRHIQVICTVSFVIMSVTMILSGTMRSYGAVVAPMVVMAIALFPARLGFYALAYPHLGGEAIWWAFPVGSVTSVGLTWLYYRFGSWRRHADVAKMERSGA
ncbi:MATE family efflux transporter [Novosphingobium sp. 9]|uniref:MATE family efflux transporter n=1 Tax=Novosphingobium sp. 9 TaxID=2025349 RepID=UPI0021B4FF89|nr:MATE family efflux transporter [Novosphingobium sp. 9]